ncbi:MAG: M48 family metalloprotease [Planctomycetota bacterium]|nr:M48 family metalloprotease [Planctomycetota bacterium]
MSLFETVVSNAIVVAAVVVLLKGLGWTCRNPPVRHAVWMLVLVKLCTPAIVPVSVLEIAPVKPLLEPPDDTMPTTTDVLISYQHITFESIASDSTMHGEFAADSSQDRSALLDGFQMALVWLRPWKPWIIAVWVTGSLAWFGVALDRSRRFRRLLLRSRLAADDIHSTAIRLAKALGIKRCPEVWLVDAHISPMLWGGWGRAEILLPYELMDCLKPAFREAVILHELAHFHRGDHFVRILEACAIGLYWWHPAVWIARRELQDAEEECCDALVLQQMPLNPRQYAETLIQAVDFISRETITRTRDHRFPTPPGVSTIGAAPFLKRRVHSIMNRKTMSRMSWIGRLLVLAIAGTLLPFLPMVGEARSQTVEPVLEETTPAKQTGETGRKSSQPADGKSKPKLRPVVKGRSVVLTITVETNENDKTSAVYVRLNEKKHAIADFIKSFPKLVETIESDESKRAAITFELHADRSVRTSQIQQVIKQAQSAGFEKFALRVAKPDVAGKAIAKPKIPRVELLADSDGKLRAIVFEDKNLGVGKQALDALAKMLLADERKEPLEQLEIVADENLMYVAVVQTLDFVTQLKIPNGKSRAIKHVSFAVRDNPPDVRGVVLSVQKQAKESVAEISIGADDGLKQGHLLSVYRTHPTTKQKQFLGRLRLSKIHPDKSVGTIIPNEKVEAVKRGDHVETQRPVQPDANKGNTDEPRKP